MTTMTALLDKQAAVPPTTTSASPSRLPAPLRATRPALQWRLVLLWLLALLLPALAASLPVWNMLGTAFDHSAQAAELARRLDLASINDLAGMGKQYGAAMTGGGIAALVLTLLLSPLLTGAAITAARAPQVPGFAALVAGSWLWAWQPISTVLYAGA